MWRRRPPLLTERRQLIVTNRLRLSLLGLGVLGIAGAIVGLHGSQGSPNPPTVFLELPAASEAVTLQDAAAPTSAPDPAAPDVVVLTTEPRVFEAVLSEPREEPEDVDARPAAAMKLPEAPLSNVPHHLLAAWPQEAQSGVPAIAGMTVIVDPSLSTAALDHLALDIRERGLGAAIFHARVYDSEEAATYDRHSDGGALAERHQVAVVTRNEPRGLDVVKVRGLELHP